MSKQSRKPTTREAQAMPTPSLVDTSEVDPLDDDTTQATPQVDVNTKYTSHSLHQSILNNTDVYAGSKTANTESMLVFDDTTNTITRKTIQFVAAQYKCVDELIANTRDHAYTHHKHPTNPCTKIQIHLTDTTFSVENNGPGIEVEIHKQTNQYVPSFIFGNVLTSSNYTNTAKKTGGKNGYGGKLANILSKQFLVETIDSNTKKSFYQRFYNNMFDKDAPVIKSAGTKKSFTRITATLDLSKFIPVTDTFTDDFKALIKKRCYDLAMCCLSFGVTVWFNGSKIELKLTKSKLHGYIELYHPITINTASASDHVILYSESDDWKVGIVYSKSNSINPETVSFVNGIYTRKGGPHVNYIVHQICKYMNDNIPKSKAKAELKITPSILKRYISVFIDSVIVNPSFDSQSKDELTTPASAFGTSLQLDDLLLKKLLKNTTIINDLEQQLNNKQDTITTKAISSININSIAKLTDAKLAGHKTHRLRAILILTEGDSAKACALAGIGVLGADYYGAFPLRGKLKNPRKVTKTTKSQLKQETNEELNQVTSIMGLIPGKVYDTNLEGLRYGGLMMLCDQDQDGLHIKSLIINYIEHNWPELTRIVNPVTGNPFMLSLNTNIVVASRNNQHYNFTNMNEFLIWKANYPHKTTIKYYKGLGSNTSTESKAYFKDIDANLIKYVDETDDGSAQVSPSHVNLNHVSTAQVSPSHSSSVHSMCELLFKKGNEDKRKDWIDNYNAGDYIKSTARTITYAQFFSIEYRSFAKYSVERAIPSIMDGFKPGQRKPFFAMYVRPNEAIKVSSLAGYVIDKYGYHHGDAALCETITKLAKNYMGSNNINYLIPHGNFGCVSVHKAAHPRYIHVTLNDLCRFIFRVEDTPILDTIIEEDKPIEPKWLAPIVPTILINGAKGIGNGYATVVLKYNLPDIIACVKQYLAKQPMPVITPFIKHFNGTVTAVPSTSNQASRYTITAKYTIIQDTVIIEQMRPYIQSEAYKDYLITITTPTIPSTSKKDSNKQVPNSAFCPDILSYQETVTDMLMQYKIVFHPNTIATNWPKDKLEKLLWLREDIHTSCMYLFDDNNNIAKYTNVYDIIAKFCDVRLPIYNKRIDHIKSITTLKINTINEMIRFIQHVIASKIVIGNKNRKQIEDQLEHHKFMRQPPQNKPTSTPTYDYLVTIPLIRLSKEEIDKLNAKLAKHQTKLNYYSNTPHHIWVDELNQLNAEYSKWITTEELGYNTELRNDMINNDVYGKPKPRTKSSTKAPSKPRAVSKKTAKTK